MWSPLCSKYSHRREWPSILSSTLNKKSLPVLETSVSIKVPFQDVDMFSIVWHGNYARYLEIARCQLLDEIGYNYLDMQASGYVFPVVDLKIRYIRSIIFNQQVAVQIRLKEWQHWLKFSYLIIDAETGERLTKCSTRQVAVDARTGKMLDQSPTALLVKIDAAFAEHAVGVASTKRQPD